MSRGVKILLGFLAAMLLLGAFSGGMLLLSLPKLGSALVSNATDRANTQRIGALIGEYRLPPGYRELMALDLLGNRFLTVGPEDRQHGIIIMLFQTTQARLDPKDVEQQFATQFNERATSTCSDFQQTGKETLAIAGKPTTFAVSECERNGVRRREQAGVFELHGHPTMLLATGRVERWDRAALHAFATSLH
jgi:hypothetical protein